MKVKIQRHIVVKYEVFTFENEDHNVSMNLIFQDVAS